MMANPSMIPDIEEDEYSEDDHIYDLNRKVELKSKNKPQNQNYRKKAKKTDNSRNVKNDFAGAKHLGENPYESVYQK